MKGVIAAGDKITAQAGAKILKEGGNAFDAAICALLTAPLAEPALTSLGGGGFLTAFSEDKDPVVYDFFVDVPPKRLENPDFFPIYVDFGSAVQEFHIGAGSIAVAGMVGGIYEVWKERGKLPFYDIVSVAKEYAKEGIYLSRMQASLIKLLEPIFRATKESERIYVKNGRLIDERELFKNEDYAEFLELFGKKGSDIFYKGEIADRLEELSLKNEGIIAKEDLLRYEVKKREPIEFDFNGYKIVTNPPPSSGGILIAFTLELLKELDLGEFGSLRHLISFIEAMKITSDFRNDHINEHLHNEKLKDILKDSHLIDGFRKSYKSRLNLWGNTTHISVIDGEYNAVSVTTTNGEGSGYVLPGCGIMLNNMLGEEDLNPHGFFKWPSYVRLPSMMSPTIVLKDDSPYLVLGSAGSNRIRSAVVSVILNYLSFHKDIKESVSLSRIHFERDEVFLEPGFKEEIVKEIKKRFKVSLFKEKNLFFGGVNAVNALFEGGADPRRGGAVMKVF